jgi:hypothetical protein
MKNKISLAYITHGIHITGGYLHEIFLTQKVKQALEREDKLKSYTEYRTNRYYNGIQHLGFFAWILKKVNADVNIFSHWIAVLAFVRLLFTKQKGLFVWHHIDKKDLTTLFSKIYFQILFFLLKCNPIKRFAVVGVSDFWLEKFRTQFSKHTSVFYFPNLFDNEYYQAFVNPVKKKQIYFGQYAPKNNPLVYELAAQLSGKGYHCYFTTTNKLALHTSVQYDIKYFDIHEAYLTEMAQSLYTVAFIHSEEGWNRVAHESILVGTQFIGNPIGGLGDLLKESNSLTAQTIDEFIFLIEKKTQHTINAYFISKYDIKNVDTYLDPILNFIKA